MKMQDANRNSFDPRIDGAKVEEEPQPQNRLSETDLCGHSQKYSSVLSAWFSGVLLSDREIEGMNNLDGSQGGAILG